jgi:mono/diheme cytochrome c family protein
MKRYQLLRFVALLALAAALPFYALREPGRMARTKEAQREQFVADAAGLFLNNCTSCHGLAGEGTSAIPALNRPALAGADFDYLFQRIAHAPHGTSMAVWHVGEGGRLSGYQAEALVTLIREEKWDRVQALAEAQAQPLALLPEPVHTTPAAITDPLAEDPHSCISCHEEPEMHANRFGLDCSRCHVLESWAPALLTRHVFTLDHGSEAQVECQVCHAANYQDNTCYGCHDHQPSDMETVHTSETRYDLRPCASCHPTGSEAVDRQLNQPEVAGQLFPAGR